MGKNTYKLFFVVLILIVLAVVPLFDTGEHHLGKGFTYFEENRSISYWKIKDTLSLDIPPRVVSYCNMKDMLFVKQHPSKYDDVMYKTIEYKYGRDTTYFWLIDKCTKNVVGPILYSEMEAYLLKINEYQLLEKLHAEKTWKQ